MNTKAPVYRKNNKVQYNILVQHIAKSSSIIVVGIVANRVISFLMQIVLARCLGGYLFGLYAIGQAIHDILVAIVSLGHGKALIRFFKHSEEGADNDKFSNILIAYICISGIFGLVLSSILFCSANVISAVIFNNSEFAIVFRGFAIAIPFYALILLGSAIATAVHNMKLRMSVQGILQPVMQIFLIGIFYYFVRELNLFYAIYAYNVSAIFCGIMFLVYIYRQFLVKNVLNIRAIKQSMRKVLGYSTPIVSVTLLSLITLTSNQIFLGIYRTPIEVAQYAIVYKLVAIILLCRYFFIIPFMPIISDLIYHKNHDMLVKIYQKIILWQAWVVFLPFIVFLFLGKELLFLFGKEYTASYPALILLATAYFVEIIPGTSQQIFEMGRKETVEFWCSLTHVCIVVFGGLYAIPRYGIEGAVIAYLFSSIFIMVVRSVLLKWHFDIHVFTIHYGLFLFSVLSFVFLYGKYIAQITLPFRFCTSAITFIVFGIYVYCSSNQEEKWIARYFKKKIVCK